MEIKVPVIIDGVKTVEELASRVLDDYEYKGMTVRQWADRISNPKTHADNIRSMTDEELANWIGGLGEDDLCPPKCAGCMEVTCEDAWLDWLKQEAKNE